MSNGQQTPGLALLWLALGIAGCSSTTSGADGGVQRPDAVSTVDTAAPATDLRGADGVSADIATVEPPATALPVGTGALLAIPSSKGGLPTSVVVRRRGASGHTLLFDQVSVGPHAGGIYRSDFQPGGAYAASVSLPVSEHELVNNLSRVVIGDDVWIYSVAGDDGWQGEVKVERRRWDGERLGQPHDVPLPQSIRHYATPWFYGLADGSVAAIFFQATEHAWPFHQVEGDARIAFSSDGRSFDSSRALAPIDSAHAGLGQFSSGALLFLYADRSGGSTFFRISTDRQIWSEPVPPSTHDTRAVEPLTRTDGGIDLYFTVAAFEDTQPAFLRRCVTQQGGLGPEQRIITSSWQGKVNGPRVSRLDSGMIVVVFANGLEDNLLYAVHLFGDAPCPP